MMTFEHITMTATVIICLLLNAFILLGEPFSTTTAAKSPLFGASFSVKTRITKPSHNLKLLLEESYSKSQNKARIRYHATNQSLDPKPSEYHFDAYNKHGLLYSPPSAATSPPKIKCDPVSLLQFYSSSLLFQFDFNRLMQLEIPDSDPVIGLARLIMLVSNRVDLLKNPFKLVAYEIPTIRYEFEIPLPGGEGNTTSTMMLMVYFREVTHTSDDSLDSQFPVFMSWKTLWFHFYQLKIHSHQETTKTQTGFLSAQEIPSDIDLDEYAVPSFSKCMQSLPKYNIYALFDMQSFKFSFEAETIDSGGTLENHLVQFDGLLQALRVDTVHRLLTPSTKSSIFNLRKNRRYLIIGEGKQKRCLVMKNLGKKRANLDMSSLLIGEGNLALLGKAKVRGIDASVYGTLSNKLPYWFDQPVLYQTNGTQEALRRRGVKPSDDDNEVGAGAGQEESPPSNETKKEKRFRYKFLIYFDESHENRLLALDVFDLLKGDESQRLLRVRFREFAWQLAEASDGKQMSEIFALSDSCSAESREAHHLEVDLLLRQDEISAIADSSNGGTWTQHRPERDSAILVGLTDSLELDCMMIYDLESQIKRDHRMAVDLHFRLSERSQLLHSLKLIGGARLRPTGNHLREIAIQHRGSAFLLTDCLFLAADSMDELEISPIYVYYSEQHSACLIDPTLNGIDEQDLSNKSPLFEINNENPTGELYQIETHLDNSNSAGIIKDKKLKALSNRIVFLTHTTGQPGQPIDPATFRMRIERMKISSNSQLDSKTDDDNSNQRSVYSGLAFSLNLGGESINRLLIKQAINASDVDEQPIKLSQCKAACLADYRCASFSYCVRFPTSECILSEIPTTEIGRNIEKLRQSSQVIAIKTETHGEVKLRRDLRCELYRKSYLVQFIKGDKEKNVLDGHWTIPVSNAEQCAQSCLVKTLQVLKTMNTGEQGEALRGAPLQNVCTRFLYLSSLLNEVQQVALREALGDAEFDVQGHLGGFCLIKHNLDKKFKLDSAKVTLFNFDYYDFDFTTLYELTSGFNLVDTSNELESTTQLRLNLNKPKQEDLDILDKAFREGRNIQSKIAITLDHQLCARRCFMQTTPLWPACRSFDVIKVNQPWPKRSSIICIFNTRLANETHNQLEHQNESSRQATIERLHYEPRWDLIENAVESESKFERRSINLRGENDSSQAGGSQIRRVLIVIGLMILALISGFALTMKISDKFLLHRKSGSRISQHLCNNGDADIAME